MKIKIKTWRQLVEEFGLNETGEFINCEFHFTERMENLLPDNRVIEVESSYYMDTIDVSSCPTEYYSWNIYTKKDFGFDFIYNISTDVVENVLE